MGAIVASDVAVRYPDYVSSLTLVNPTSIEVNYLKNVCLESMPITIRNWDDEEQDKFLNKKKYYKPRKMNKF